MLQNRFVLLLSVQLILGGLIFSAPLAAEKSVEELLRSARYSENQKELIETVFNSANEKGIENELLISRLEEGVAKRVPASRLIAALEREIEFLETARMLFLEIDSGETLLLNDDLWRRAAHMLSWGITALEFKSIAAACVQRPEAFQPATFLFVIIVEWGMDRATGIELCVAVIKSEIETDEFAGVLDVLIRGRRLLVSPQTMSKRILESLPDVTNLRQLADRTLYE